MSCPPNSDINNIMILINKTIITAISQPFSEKHENPARVNIFQLTSAVSDYHENYSYCFMVLVAARFIAEDYLMPGGHCYILFSFCL